MFALVFPLVLTVVLVTTAILEIMVIKSSISGGIYDVVQELTYSGGDKQEAPWKSQALREEAKQMIIARMASGNFLQQYLADGANAETLSVTITPPPFNGRRTLCEDAVEGVGLRPEQLRFNVAASLNLKPLKNMPILGSFGYGTEFGTFTLAESATGFVDCPRWQPAQKREGCLFPGLCELFR